MPKDDVKFIAVEGPVKTENSALARQLAKRFEAELVSEEGFRSPFIDMASADPQDLLFKKHILRLLDCFQAQKRLTQTEIFYERAVCDYLFYADRIVANLHLREDQLPIYDVLMNFMEKEIAIPDIVIYLQNDTETIIEKFQNRHALQNNSRDRKKINEEYIHALNDEFNQFFIYYRWSPVLIVNANSLDVSNALHADDLYKRVQSELSGVVYYNPPGKS